MERILGIDWYKYIDEEWEFIVSMVKDPAKTWEWALSKGGEICKILKFDFKLNNYSLCCVRKSVNLYK